MKQQGMWALATVVAGAVAGCSAANRPDQIEVRHEENISVGGGPNLLPPNALDVPQAGTGLRQGLTSSLDNQGVSASDVKSVTLAQFSLEVTEPLRNGQPIQDLRFLDSVVMTFGGDGLPDVTVAQSLPPPGGSTQSASFAQGVFQVDIPVTPGLELKDYVTGPQMTVGVEVVANGRPALSCTVKSTIVLKVQLNPVGAAQNRLPAPG